jgi:hypothetical protein
MNPPLPPEDFAEDSAEDSAQDSAARRAASAAARRLRQAQDVLDERPAAKVRAAILEAAARRQAPATASGTAPDRSGRARWFAWRPRFAAVGAALAGVLAISIGLRVQQEANLTPADVDLERAARQAPAAPPSGAAAAGASGAVSGNARAGAAAPGRDEAAVRAFPAAPTAGAGAAATAAATAAKAAPAAPAAPAANPVGELPALPADNMERGAVPSSRSLSSPATVDRPGAAPFPAPATAPAAGAAAPGAASEPGSAQAAASSERKALPAAPARQLDQVQLPSDMARARAVRPAPAYRASPEAWLERIATLRAAQRDAEAEEELQLFAAAHPGVALPPSVLRH